MGISKAELRREQKAARANGWDAICRDAEAEKGLPGGILLAVASRETDMADVVGDGGHGRGLFQIDDRSWKEWLTAHGAGGGGLTPPVTDAARLAAAYLSENLAFGRKNGVSSEDLLKFALSAYNAGAGGAIRGYREGDSDLHTTGGDYGRDVLERLAGFAGRDGGKDVPPEPSADGLLRVGSRGDLVTLVKQRLQQWFDLNSSGEWAALGVEPGPVFSKRLRQAVRVFQERRGLLVDGIVGAETLGALGVVSVAPAPPPLPAPADLTLDRVYHRRSGGLYVRLIQGWLVLHGYTVAVDGEFGAATVRRVRDFQTQNGLPATGIVDQATYDRLTAPMRAALAALPRAASLGAMIVAYARQHLAAGPHEVQSFPNDGPWVRLYMDGNEGDAWPWCAGFATYVMQQACATMGAAPPVRRTFACDDMAADARSSGAFLASPGPQARGRITPGSFYLRRATSGPLEYAHVGIVIDADGETVRSIEGNTSSDAGTSIAYVAERVQDYSRKDFVLVQ